MRLLRWPARKEGAIADPTPYDRWLIIGRWVALASALLLAVLSLVPAAMDAGAANDGADVNVTSEFYTVFDGGGGYITWDFAPTAANRLRASIDVDGSGDIDQGEYSAYQTRVDSTLERNILVVRNFEISAARIEEQHGIAGEAVNSSVAAHLKVILSGGWAAKDADIALVGGGAVLAAFPDIGPTDRVKERTIVVAAGLSSFDARSSETRVPRVPAGAVVVHTESYTWSQVGALPVDARFERFSVASSTILLLAPMAVALYLGVRRPRVEQESSGQRRIVPFHNALSAGFLLLVVSYFAGVPGIVLWVAAIAFGAVGMWATYRLYPLDGPRATLAGARQPAVPASDPAPSEAASPASLEKALSLMAEAHRPVGERRAADDWAPVGLDEADPESVEARTPPGPPRSNAPPLTRPTSTGGPVGPPRTPVGRLPAVSLVRCPGCRHQFEAAGARPLSVACPHCGKRGVLR